VPALGMDKSKDIHPLIALSDWGFDGRSLWGPNPSKDRFEANAMLIHRPQFDDRLRVGVMYQGDLLGQFF
jgi:hypothetical protein